MPLIELPKPLTAHTEARASEVMANFNKILELVNGELDLENLASSLRHSFFSVGDLKPSALSAAPEGWLMCDGSPVSRTTYAALFAAISTTFGAGNGSTTFNVPDLRGRVIVAPDGGIGRVTWPGIPNTLGGGGGHQLLQTHLHAISLNTGVESANHVHNVFGFAQTRHEGTGLAYTNYDATPGSGFSQTDTVSAFHTHAVNGNTANEGGQTSSQNMQPFLVCNYMIKT